MEECIYSVQENVLLFIQQVQEQEVNMKLFAQWASWEFCSTAALHRRRCKPSGPKEHCENHCPGSVELLSTMPAPTKTHPLHRALAAGTPVLAMPPCDCCTSPSSRCPLWCSSWKVKLTIMEVCGLVDTNLWYSGCCNTSEHLGTLLSWTCTVQWLHSRLLQLGSGTMCGHMCAVDVEYVIICKMLLSQATPKEHEQCSPISKRVVGPLLGSTCFNGCTSCSDSYDVLDASCTLHKPGKVTMHR